MDRASQSEKAPKNRARRTKHKKCLKMETAQNILKPTYSHHTHIMWVALIYPNTCSTLRATPSSGEFQKASYGMPRPRTTCCAKRWIPRICNDHKSKSKIISSLVFVPSKFWRSWYFYLYSTNLGMSQAQISFQFLLRSLGMGGFRHTSLSFLKNNTSSLHLCVKERPPKYIVRQKFACTSYKTMIELGY